MFKKKILGLILMGLVVCTTGFAEPPEGHMPSHWHRSMTDTSMHGKGANMEVKNTLVTTGEIVRIDDEGLVTVKGTGDYDLISLHINKADKKSNKKGTQIYDSHGKKVSSKSLRLGTKVECYYDASVTRSYPGQSNAKAVIVKEKESSFRTSLLRVSKVTENDEKHYVTIEASNDEIIASIDKKACKDYNHIETDNEILIWYGIMTMSLPPQTSAIKAIVL